MNDGSGSREIKRGVTRPIRSNVGLSLLRLSLICFSILSGGIAYGQAVGNQAGGAAGSVAQDNLARAVSEVKEGNWASVDEIVKEAGPVRAVPILHDLFAGSQDIEVKERVAGELVKLGDRDDVYFNFMLVQAIDAVDNDVPFPFHIPQEGSPVPKPQPDSRQDPDALLKQVSPEFVAWAKSRGLSVNSAAQEAVYTIPGRLLQIGMTGDKRAIPVLRRGLSSPNFMIQVMAAQGLAELKDKDSIPLIIAASERTPAAGAVAMALRSFDDPRAQSVYQSFLAKLQEAGRKQSAGQDTNLDADQPKK